MAGHFLDADATRVVGLTLDDVRYYKLQAQPIRFASHHEVAPAQPQDHVEEPVLEMSLQTHA